MKHLSKNQKESISKQSNEILSYLQYTMYTELYFAQSATKVPYLIHSSDLSKNASYFLTHSSVKWVIAFVAW